MNAAACRRATGSLLAAATLSLASGLGGCALAVRARPSPVDSLVARTALAVSVAEWWQHQRLARPDVAAEAGIAALAVGAPSLHSAKLDAQFARGALLALDEIRVDALTEDDYVTWQSLRWEMEQLAGWPAFHWTRRGDLQPGQSALERAVKALRDPPLRDSTDVARWLTLLRTVPAMVRGLQVELAERLARDVSLPRRLQERAMSLVRSFVAPPDSSPFGPPDSVAAMDSEWARRAVAAARSVIATEVNPSLDMLIATLEGARAASPEDLSIGTLPGGREHYAALLRYHATIDITPEAAHAIGLREVARLAARADSARRAAGLPASPDSLRAFLARDARWSVEDRSALPEVIARRFAAWSTELDSLFGPVPTGRLVIGLMSGATEDSAEAVYEPPAVGRAARYRANAERVAERSSITLAPLVLETLVPGWHRQQSAQRENEALPVFRRLAWHTGFVEGWSAYVLPVADSALPSLSPFERYAVRLRELGVACGLVVDTGIHAFGWSARVAADFLRRCLPWTERDLERMVTEAAEQPGRLAGVALGAREFHGLRHWVERELGPLFGLAAFHREVLRTGSVPLPVLGAHLERWIWEVSSAGGMLPR